jgi:hypothetical protein
MNHEEAAGAVEPAKATGPAYDTIICERCGQEAIPLHLGCRLCEDCCDCRPSGS